MNMPNKNVKQRANKYKFLKKYVLKFFIAKIRNKIATSIEAIGPLPLCIMPIRLKNNYQREQDFLFFPLLWLNRPMLNNTPKVKNVTAICVSIILLALNW